MQYKFRQYKFLQYKLKKTSAGITLLEVMVALLISGIFLSAALYFLVGQWRTAKELRERLELQYAVVSAGKTVSDAIRTARALRWVEPGVLRVQPPESVVTPDQYYLDDKDFDGIRDLYWDHLNVPNPVASRISDWECREVEPGLWQIRLHASQGNQRVEWEGLIRQRAYIVPAT